MCFEVNGFNGLTSKSMAERQRLKVNIKVKGFRSPGATYFLFPEKKVGKESGLPGRQGQKRWCFWCFWFRGGACGSAGILPLPVRLATIWLAVWVAGLDL